MELYYTVRELAGNVSGICWNVIWSSFSEAVPGREDLALTFLSHGRTALIWTGFLMCLMCGLTINGDLMSHQPISAVTETVHCSRNPLHRAFRYLENKVGAFYCGNLEGEISRISFIIQRFSIVKLDLLNSVPLSTNEVKYQLFRALSHFESILLNLLSDNRTTSPAGPVGNGQLIWPPRMPRILSSVLGDWHFDDKFHP